MAECDYYDAATGEGVSDFFLDQRYRDMLDEAYEPVNIAGLEYSTSNALRLVDPIAYTCGFNDWLDSELGETLLPWPPAAPC